MGDCRVRHRVAGRLVAAVVALSVVAGCTVAGSAVIAPYRSPSLALLTARAIRAAGGNVLALSPDGGLVAVSDPAHGICLESIVPGARALCADLTLTGNPSITAAFAPDGQSIAVGRDVRAQGSGTVWLVDVHTGKARPIPPVVGSPAAAGTTGTAAPRRPPPAAAASQYIAMVWNAASGHLLLIGNSFDATGRTTRLVDVDPASLIPRVVALATGPYEFQSGYLATGGPKVIFTVYRGDQAPPNLVVVDLAAGVRKEFGPLGPHGTQLVPLAVSPDGRQAVVGSASIGVSGPPRLLDLSTGILAEIPGLTGNFALASYSPNGGQIGLVSQSATRATVAVVPRSAVGVRTLSAVRATIAGGSRLTWSGSDVLSIVGATPMPAGSVVGWSLSGH